MSQNENSTRSYWLVYAALLALLYVTVQLALVDLGPFNLIAALTVSVIKTILILLIFMHVRKSGRVIAVFAGASFFWIALAAALLLTDYLTR